MVSSCASIGIDRAMWSSKASTLEKSNEFI
jgi:hypothetical protein